jgi:hypothetical protein
MMISRAPGNRILTTRGARAYIRVCLYTCIYAPFFICQRFDLCKHAHVLCKKTCRHACKWHMLIMTFTSKWILQERGSLKPTSSVTTEASCTMDMTCMHTHIENQQTQVPEISPSVRISSTWYACKYVHVHVRLKL